MATSNSNNLYYNKNLANYLVEMIYAELSGEGIKADIKVNMSNTVSSTRFDFLFKINGEEYADTSTVTNEALYSSLETTAGLIAKKTINDILEIVSNLVDNSLASIKNNIQIYENST